MPLIDEITNSFWSANLHHVHVIGMYRPHTNIDLFGVNISYRPKSNIFMTQFISIFAFQMASCVLLMGSVRKTGSRPSSNHRLLHSVRSRLVIAFASSTFLLLFHGKLIMGIPPRWLLRWSWAVVVLHILAFTVRSNVNITVVLVDHIPSLFSPFLSVLVGTG